MLYYIRLHCICTTSSLRRNTLHLCDHFNKYRFSRAIIRYIQLQPSADFFSNVLNFGFSDLFLTFCYYLVIVCDETVYEPVKTYKSYMDSLCCQSNEKKK